MIITIIEGEPTYTAEQIWLLLAALSEHPKINLNIRERGEEVSGPSEYLKKSEKEYACLKCVGYSVSEDAAPYSFVIDVRMAQFRSQETFNGAYKTERVFWYAQHDGWDLDTQQYVEQWYHTMQLRLSDVEPNVSIGISGG